MACGQVAGALRLSAAPAGIVADVLTVCEAIVSWTSFI
ncbi:hypothetical protein C882_3360 [Caenispirillum salinarum AK4]|uniref:Uncharacterized protein n=1 Tax=Caenispirillum salinarum AK4 TaxID=1238182 RepID=K9HB18_9PROT|nr:hypothetical protein C882_3360 [Caenispirillum salinarum AK4]